MLRGSKTLLDLCTERFPSPRTSQHHSLIVREGTMVLTLMQGDTYQSFNLSEVDLERDPESLVDELAVLLAAPSEEPLQVDVPVKPIPDETA